MCVLWIVLYNLLRGLYWNQILLFSFDVSLAKVIIQRYQEINRSQYQEFKIWFQTCYYVTSGVFKLFCQLNPFDLNYLLEVSPEISSKYLCMFNMNIYVLSVLMFRHQANQKRGSWILIRQAKIEIFLAELLKEEMFFGTYTANIYS